MTLYKNRDKIKVLAKAKIKKGGKKYKPILQPNILAVLIRKLANNAYIERTRDGDGEKSSDLIKEYGYKTRKSLEDKVKKYGYKMRTREENESMQKMHRKFSIKNIDSPFKAYWLGLMITDGWIRKDGKEFFICTGSEKFAYFIKDILENKLYMTELNVVEGIGSWTVRSAEIKNINILKTIVYDRPYGMSRKYNVLHGGISETTMESAA